MYRTVCDKNKIMGMSRCRIGRREFYVILSRSEKISKRRKRENMDQIEEEVQECGRKTDRTKIEDRRRLSNVRFVLHQCTSDVV
jgi:hypothetical protein